VPIAVVSSHGNIRTQIQLFNQLIGAGEGRFSVHVSTGRRRPRIVESGSGDPQHLRDMALGSA
jgi:hypothetical protein